MSGSLMPVPRMQFFDDSGDPLSGGLIYFYVTGTSTPLTVYSDSALTVPLSNPVVLDSAGRAAIYLQNAAYKVICKTSASVTLWTQDPVVTNTDADTVDGAHYSVGVFTPIISASGGASGQVYSVQVGAYVKMGRSVMAYGRVILSTLGTLTGTVRIGGLPFASDSTTNLMAPMNIGYPGALTTAVVWVGGFVPAGATSADLYMKTAAAANPTGVAQADLSALSDFIFSVTYRTA